jgi:hypothetical protein
MLTIYSFDPQVTTSSVKPMTNPTPRELIQRLTGALGELRDLIPAIMEGSYKPDFFTLQPLESAIQDVSIALAQPEPVPVAERLPGPEVLADDDLPPRVGHVLRLAEIIREVDGSHGLGAAALAEAILSHPGSRWRPAIEPVPVSDHHLETPND